MDTGAGKRRSRGAHAGSLEIEDQAPFSPLTELALVVPRKMVHAVRGLLRPGTTQPGRDGIDVPPMSGDWLQQAAADCGKHGDAR